jgi:hypothetical protein
MTATSRSRDRSHGGDPSFSSDGLRSPSRTSQGAAAKRGVPVCLTCLAKFDARWNEGRLVFYDHGTETVHRCKEKP